MIGFYNYTVVLTYISMAAAFIGMTFSFGGNFKGAVVCLMLSGVCDMCDGAVARTRKRNEYEKNFGIQIDSLCDVVSFGVQPAVIVYCIVVQSNPGNKVFHILAFLIGICFALCAVIRLAFFNVMEEERVRKEGNKPRTGYQGLPVTNIALIFPIIYLTKLFLPARIFSIVVLAALAIVGFLFIKNFKMFKATPKQELLIGFCGLLIFIVVCIV